ncbi:aldose 1-epimerase family protein [Treponema brennaborense]|nr:aldose 1-epimerase family protein [Treponema brennaborense]
MVTLKNDRYEAVIDSHGAELHSLRSIADGTEYIWNGDPSVWKFHAPVLFPHVGRIKDQYMTSGGKTYALAVNGFSRDMEHTLLERSDTSAVWELTESAETVGKFPWKFSLKTYYELNGAGISFRTEVTNTDSEEMSFSLGSHTAFCCPRGTEKESFGDYRIEFEKREPLTAVCLTENGYLEPDADGTCPCTRPYGETERGVIPLTEKGFGTGHFFTAFTSDWIGVRNRKTGSLVKVNTAGYPYVMIWQNAGEPRFVCIEPWYGTPDPDNTDHRWEHKPALISLAPGESFRADQSISIE